MLKYLKQYKSIIAIIVYLLLIGVAYYFVARPLISKIKDENNKIQEKVSQQENREQKIKEIPALKNQYEMIGKDEEKLNVILNEEKVVDLIKELENISEETGNKIKIDLPAGQDSKSVSSSSKKKGSKDENSLITSLANNDYMRINITLSGNYESFLNFLNKIENLNYCSEIISLKISEGSGNNDNTAVNPFSSDSTNADNIIAAEKNKINSVLEIIFYLAK